MNITRLFMEENRDNEVVHVRDSRSRITRHSKELASNVARLCAGLVKAGVEPGHCVLILSNSRVEMVEALLATFNIGAIAVPLNPLIGTANLVSVVQRLQPYCCFIEDAPDESVQEALRDCDCMIVSFSGTTRPFCVRWRVFDTLLAGADVALEHSRFDDRHPALIIHGSGSSGQLKAVQMSHGALFRFFEYHDFIYAQYSDAPDRLKGGSAILTGLPLSHLAGLATCLQGLMSGRRTFLLSFFLPDLYLRIIEEARCTFIMLVPSLFRALLKEPYLQQMDRSALRFCITGGEGVSAELAEQVRAGFGVPLVTAYSMTECSSGIGHLRHDLHAGRIKPTSCGQQVFGELRLCDADGQGSREFGELWVRNATVHPCYLDAHLNQARLTHGWFRTGDLFYRDEDGDFFHRGRIDDMFICNGKNLYPAEIEATLMRHPAVDAVCAVPVQDPKKGTVPGVLVVRNGPLSASQLQEFAMLHGSSHAVPQRIRFAEALPSLGSGKVDRARVVRLLEADALILEDSA